MSTLIPPVKKFLPLLLLALLVFGAYAPTVWNGFVWDDQALILRDPLIRSWRLIPEGFQHFLFTDAAASDFYRPVQRLTYTLDYAAFGLHPAPYHIASIAWHLAAAVALFFFASELLKTVTLGEGPYRLVPIAAAIAWAIHPVQTSAVAYASGRADSLAAAFGFAGLWFGLRGLRSAGAGLWVFSAAAGLSLLLSALSKELGLIYPVLWLALIVAAKNWKAARSAGVAIAFVLAIYLSLRLPAEHIAPPPGTATPVLVRPILVARAFAEYTGLILFPFNLHMERDVETRAVGFSDASLTSAAWRELQTLAGIILMAAFIYWLIRERKRDRTVFLLLLLTMISYLPVSGIFSLNASIAEHWLYLPTAFLILAAALTIARQMQLEPVHVRWSRPLVLSALTGWLLFLGGRTFVRTFDWKDQRTFLDRTMADGGQTARMLINLAGLEMSEGRLDVAREHLQEALKKEPDQPLGVVNLAAVAIKQQDYPLAHEMLKRAKEMPLVEAQAYELLTVLENKETGHANILRMRLAARSGPPNWAIEKRYVKVLDESGAIGAAISELRGCVAQQWYRADSWQLLSELLAKSGRAAEATDALARAWAYDVRLGEHPVIP